MGPETGVHIQHSEQMWASATWKNKMHHSKHNPESHLCEFMCRNSVKVKIHLTKVILAIKECFVPSGSSIKHGN